MAYEHRLEVAAVATTAPGTMLLTNLSLAQYSCFISTNASSVGDSSNNFDLHESGESKVKV